MAANPETKGSHYQLVRKILNISNIYQIGVF